ncbi:hypothetical protein M1E08_09585 [Erwinia sp. PK3-005]
MEYLSFIVSVSSVLAALLAAYISRKNKVELEKKLKEFNRKKQDMKNHFDQKSNEMRL